MQQRTRLGWRAWAAGALAFGLALAGWLVAGSDGARPKAALEPTQIETASGGARRAAPELQEPSIEDRAADPQQRVQLPTSPAETEEPAEATPPPTVWILGENLVEGIVLDAATREPIGGARIRMEGFEVQSTETAEDGTFRLEASDFVRALRVAASGYAPQMHYPLRLPLVPVDERGYVIYMEPGGQLFGVAKGSDGLPVTTGLVKAYESQFLANIGNRSPKKGVPRVLTGWRIQAWEGINGNRPIAWLYSLTPTAPIDEEGHFHFDSLPTGTPLELAIWSDEVLMDIHEEPSLRPKEVREVELTSRRASSLTGTIELPFGVHPEASAIWFTLKQRDPLVPNGPFARIVPVGPAGGFSSGPLPPNEHIWIQALLSVDPDGPEQIILEWQHDLAASPQKLHLRMNGVVEDLTSGS
jgi:hypothetical protein